MKKFIVTLMCIMPIFVFAACGEPKEASDTSLADIEGVTVVEVEEENPATEDEDVIVVGGAPEASEEGNDYLTKDAVAVTANGVKIVLGDDFLPNVEAVGEAEVVEGQACLDGGFDTNYYYGGEELIVYTYASEGKQVVYGVYSESADYAINGVTIGSTTKDDVVNSLGTPNEETGSTFTYYVEDTNTTLNLNFDGSDVLESIDVVEQM